MSARMALKSFSRILRQKMKRTGWSEIRSTRAFSSPMPLGSAPAARSLEVQRLDRIHARRAQGGVERAEEAAGQAQGGGDQGPLATELHDQGREEAGQIPREGQREHDA